jgi:arylsulfatase A-like enzyme
MKLRRVGLWTVAFAALCLGIALDAPGAAPPNVIWIWADNLAWGDLHCYGSGRHETPALDRLAAGGARFTQFYTAHTICSPARAALLTGRQPFRSGIVDVLYPDSPFGLPAEEITLAELLRGQGYATAAIGKWHLGDRREFLPRQHGFDSYFGMPLSMDMLPAILCRDDDIIEQLPGDKVAGITERYTDEAIRFVTANRERPFFLYLSHTLPHPPLVLPARARHPGATLYADAVRHLDEQVGRLLEATEKLGLAGRTLVMFSSDNGPLAEGADLGPLRGGINDEHEGGLRVPFIASWPGTLPAGRVVDVPAILYDIFPTVARLAGARLPADRVYDGQDIWPLLTGRGEFRQQRPFIWVYHDNVTTVRDGQWKLHAGRGARRLAKPELYDIEADAGERRDLAAQKLEVVARLMKQIEDYRSQVPKVWQVRYTVRDPAKAGSGLRRHK